MFVSVSTLAAVIACLPVVWGAVVPSQSSAIDPSLLGLPDNPLPYPQVNDGITWTGPVFRSDNTSSKMVTLSGTFESIHDQLLKKNPRWDDDFCPDKSAAFDMKHMGPHEDEDDSHHSRIEKRNHYYCNRWRGAHGKRIRQGMDYIESLYLQSIDCVAGAGPGTCNRISCSWESAIFLCNDNPYPFRASCHYAWYETWRLLGYCGNNDDDLYWSGQSFKHDYDWNFNVLVKWDDC